MSRFDVEDTTLNEVLTQMAEERMPESHEAFTLTDRRELMRQGLQLEALGESMLDLKVLFNRAIELNEQATQAAKNAAEAIQSNMEKRIRALEDERLVLKTQLRTFLVLAGFIGGAIGTAVELAFKFWFNK